MSLILTPSARRPVRTAPLPVDPQTTVHHTPPLPAAPALVTMLLLMLGVVPQSSAASLDELKVAKRAYEEGHFDRARDAYKRMSKEKEPPAPPDELAYGIGASTLQLKDYESAARAFSDALQSTDADVQRRSQRGIATALYNQGDMIMAKQPERTIKAWTDSRDHFDSALKITPEGTPEHTELKANRDFVQKRLDELKKEQEQKQQNKDKQQQQGKGKGEGKPQEQQPGDKQDEPKEEGDEQKTDAIEKEQGALPEGQIRAGEGGKPDEKQQGKEQGEEDKRNDQTGFSPQEARSQLRSYADDQKSVQYLMREERPAGGKDY